MTKARASSAVRTSRSAFGLLLALQCAGCEQPRPLCSVARGSFAATYVLVDGSGPCAELHGELLGVDAYSAPTSSKDPTPNYKRMSIAIQPQRLTDLLADAEGRGASNADDVPYALGAFASAEPASNLCSVPMLGGARVRLPALPPIDACTSETEATDVSYQFSNVQVYVTPDAYGTQLSADLTYAEQGCQARYRVWAVYPAVPCAAPEPEPELDAGDEESDAGVSPREAGPSDAGRADDAAIRDAGAAPKPEGDAACFVDEAPAAPPVADPSLCASMADPALGHATGSGIHVDFAVRCDPELLLCVATKEPPSLR
jgi:hypothetical protein